MTYEQIIERLYTRGYEVFIVGGAVRDKLCGNKPTDIDIVTNATPIELEVLFEDRNIKTTGTAFNVTMIDNIEVATYRQDLYSHTNQIYIVKAKTIEEDLQRRDFTINAMAIEPKTGNIIDPYNGQSDLENKIIRFVGDPLKRLTEDPVRLLRACRFTATINGTLEANTFNAIKKYAHLITHFTPERVQLEIMKAMKAQKASTFFHTLHAVDGLKYIFPALDNCYDLDGGQYHAEDVFTHNMLCGDYITCKKPYLKLTGYLHDIGKSMCMERFYYHENYSFTTVNKYLTALKFPSACTEYVANLCKLHMSDFHSPKAIRKLLTKLKKVNIHVNDFLRLYAADYKANLKHTDKLNLKQIIKNIDEQMVNQQTAFSITDLAVNGHDVMDTLNIPQGKEVGNVLNALFKIVTKDPSVNTREILIQKMKEVQ